MPASSDVITTVFALLHPVADAAPRHVSAAWTFEPPVLVLLAAAAAVYVSGVRRLWAAAGHRAAIRPWQAGCFAAGWTIVLVALVSPVDAISAELSSVHMVQHELLIVGAAPLMVVGLPFTALLVALPFHARQTLVRLLRTRWLVTLWSLITAPAVVWIVHAAALWAWHVPVLYEAALHSERVHALEHASFFVTAALFWWGIAGGRYGRLSYGAAVVYVFATALHSGLLGAALTIAPSAWYPSYAASTTAWGLTPLEDQQLAGLIMWVPAGLVFTAVGLLFFAAWLRESERRSRFTRAVSALSVLAAVAGIAAGCSGDIAAQAAAMTAGDPERGRHAITQYGCDTCHTIPGVRSARGKVGPPLGGIASRVYLAGHLPNTPANMQDWIRRPHAHDPQTVMPETGITPEEARDVSAYLYTLR